MNDSAPPAYQVLARKYRPETFADLVGQDAMVRTLKNAFEADRIAHAFVMTGIRGVGKTTTARIIAKGMNCVGPDGAGGPTTDPCGTCEHCVAITEGRHVDVLEMDAASRTGVGDIREIIDSVAYRAASARYKIYVIDEVHMLSTSAFNALLKTLEEPPEHVKFIFATTEIRKVPVTVLSRCQRFDLKRIAPERMIEMLRGIAEAEGTAVPDDALALIARAAEGSARDATSLLDQAISHGGGAPTLEQIRTMLGLADRGRSLDLFDLIMKGDAAAALAELSSQHADGAEPMAVLRDLADITHWISVIKISPETADDPAVGPDERERGVKMAAGLTMATLTRAWQMLLKSLEETADAPSAMMAAEMAVIRLTHVSEMPAPAEILSKIAPEQAAAAAESAKGNNSPPKAGGATAKTDSAKSEAGADSRPAEQSGAPASQSAPAQDAAPQADEGAPAEADSAKPDADAESRPAEPGGPPASQSAPAQPPENPENSEAPAQDAAPPADEGAPAEADSAKPDADAESRPAEPGGAPASQSAPAQPPENPGNSKAPAQDAAPPVDEGAPAKADSAKPDADAESRPAEPGGAPASQSAPAQPPENPENSGAPAQDAAPQADEDTPAKSESAKEREDDASPPPGERSGAPAEKETPATPPEEPKRTESPASGEDSESREPQRRDGPPASDAPLLDGTAQAAPAPENSGPEGDAPPPARAAAGGGGAVVAATAPAAQTQTAPDLCPTFEDAVELIRSGRDIMLVMDIEQHMHLVSYRPGLIEFRPGDDAPGDLAARIGAELKRLTDSHWSVMIVSEGGGPTLAEITESRKRDLQRLAAEHPIAKSVLAAFPGARITVAPHRGGTVDGDASAATPVGEDTDEGWDPFDEEV